MVSCVYVAVPVDVDVDAGYALKWVACHPAGRFADSFQECLYMSTARRLRNKSDKCLRPAALRDSSSSACKVLVFRF